MTMYLVIPTTRTIANAKTRIRAVADNVLNFLIHGGTVDGIKFNPSPGYISDMIGYWAIKVPQAVYDKYKTKIDNVVSQINNGTQLMDEDAFVAFRKGKLK